MLQIVVKKYLYSIIFFLIIFLTTFNISKSDFSFFFKIKNVIFNETKFLEESTKVELLNFLLNEKIFFFDKSKIINLLNKSSWVEKVFINNQFPNKLKINIIEYYPIGYFEQNNQIFILNSGYFVSNYNNNISLESVIKFKNIQNKNNLKKLMNELKNYNNFLNLINEIHYKYEDRWDIILKNGILIKFENTNLDNKIKTIETLLKDEKIKKIDLRMRNYIIISNDR